jgi:hypothetical protein
VGAAASPSPVLLLLAAFSRHETAVHWARHRAETAWGPAVLESPAFEFDQTDYYRDSMGPGLRKQFFAFGASDPGGLADWKLATNAWEAEYAAAATHDETRPLNLDPGYVALGRLVLASTKDFAHRIYLSRGIYAEVTLYYRHGHWQHHDFTFADYRRAEYQEFFSACREQLHRLLKEGRA